MTSALVCNGSGNVFGSEWSEVDWRSRGQGGGRGDGGIGGGVNGNVNSPGEESMFSDDQGFFTCTEPEDTTAGETEEEGEVPEEEVVEEVAEGEEEREERRKVEDQVEREYNDLVKKYVKTDMLRLKDPLKDVNWVEMCVVLRMSGERSGLVIATQLLDVMLQLYSRQVVFCQRFVTKIVEELNRLNKNKRKSGENGGEADEGYGSQPNSQESILEGEDERSRSPPRIARYTFKRNKSFIASNEDQLLNDFVKERSAHIVTRRINLHDHCTQNVQNPYMDYEFDMKEYYGEDVREEMGSNDSDNLAQSARNLFTGLARFTSGQRMKQLYLPPRFWEGENEEDGGGGMEEPLEDWSDAVRFGGIENEENANPLPLEVILQEMGAEPVAPDEENLIIIPSAGLEGEEGGENTVPKEKEKKKRKRRVPFMEQQNLDENGVPADELPDAKRARLDEDPGVPDAIAAEEQERERLQNLVGVGIDGSLNDSGLGHFLNGGENDAMQDLMMPILYPAEDYAPGEGDYEEMDELTPVDYEGSFRPPSPLSKKDSSTINFQTKTSQVNMSAIKCKFQQIVQDSQRQPTPAEITFVEILQKSEMDILVGPNKTIPFSPEKNQSLFNSSTTSDSDHTAPPSSSTPFGGPKEVSVGIAFLAMLHNAANDRFFLVEDNQGAFKVTKERPVDLQSSSPSDIW